MLSASSRHGETSIVANGLETKATLVEQEMDMEQLFDKTYDELREAFVRARFAEPNVFSRPDIEEWLAEYGVPELFRWTSTWEAPAFVTWISDTWDAQFTNDRARILADCATPGPIPEGLFDHGSAYVATRSLSRMVHSNVAVYSTAEPTMLVIADQEGGLTITKGGRPDVVIISSTTADDVLRILFKEIRREHQKAHKALAWLKEQYTAAIKSARTGAKRDFDEAVAVSEDGTKIVKAEWVWVVLSKPPWDGKRRIHGLLYPGSAFHGTKIRLAVKKKRIFDADRLASARSESAAVTAESCIKAMWLGMAGQTFVDDRTANFGSLLSTTQYFCPTPLPQGGREIRV